SFDEPAELAVGLPVHLDHVPSVAGRRDRTGIVPSAGVGWPDAFVPDEGGRPTMVKATDHGQTCEVELVTDAIADDDSERVVRRLPGWRGFSGSPTAAGLPPARRSHFAPVPAALHAT